LGNRIVLPVRSKKDDFKMCIECGDQLTNDNKYKYHGYVHSVCKICRTKKARSYAAKRKKALEGTKWF
tara:strand:+ start:245 stop:448 length:204 start_codon:yes stop_codon:yes gene_type:complete